MDEKMVSCNPAATFVKPIIDKTILQADLHRQKYESINNIMTMLSEKFEGKLKVEEAAALRNCLEELASIPEHEMEGVRQEVKRLIKMEVTKECAELNARVWETAAKKLNEATAEITKYATERRNELVELRMELVARREDLAKVQERIEMSKAELQHQELQISSSRF